MLGGKKVKKLNKFNIRKKFIAIMFLLITLFGTAQPIFAISSSGTGKWVAGQWDSEVFTTDNKTSVGMLMRRLVNYTTGERITTFCGEHFINSPTRNNREWNTLYSNRSINETSV